MHPAGSSAGPGRVHTGRMAERGEQRATARRTMDRLRAMRMAGGAQLTAFVSEILAQEHDPDVTMAALAALPKPPPREVAGALRTAWEWFAANGKRRDPGGFVRTGILQALAPIATSEDRAAFVTAIETMEPSAQEGSGPGVLRAAGLAGLHGIEPEAAAPYAAGMLADPHRLSRMNGEPGITAARVLFATGDELLLFTYVMVAPRLPAEVAAECLRSLTELPEPLRAACVERFADDAEPLVQLGLCDLVVQSRMAGAAEKLLKTLEDTEVYASLVSSIVASRDTGLAQALLSHAKLATAREKLTLLAESLGLMRGDAGAEAVLESVRKKLGR